MPKTRGYAKRSLEAINPEKFESWLSRYSYLDEERFWQAVSPYASPTNLTTGDNMAHTLAKWGYTKANFRDNLADWLQDCSFSSNISVKDNANVFLDNMKGLTFLKRFDRNQGTNNANFSIGSATATFTASRGASNPATYVDSAGVIQVTTTSNVPRFTQGFYDSTGFVSRPGLIVEGAGTNALTYASVLDNAAWSLANSVVGNPTVSADNATAPDGTASAYKVSYPAVSGTQYSSLKQIQTTTNVLYTSSIFVKAATAGDVGKKLYIYQDGQINQTTITLTASWTRWNTVGTTAIAAGAKNLINIASLGVGVGGADQGAVSAYIWGAQGEILPFASTFIPTTTAALTRNAETLTYPISGNRTAATESIFLKYTPLYNPSTITDYQALIDTETKRRYITQFYSGAGHTKIQSKPNSTDSGSVLSKLTSDVTQLSSSVIASVFHSTVSPYSNSYFNGSSQDSFTTSGFTANAWGTNFRIGQNNSGNENAYIIIQSLAIFSDAKSAANVLAISNLMAGA